MGFSMAEDTYPSKELALGVAAVIVMMSIGVMLFQLTPSGTNALTGKAVDMPSQVTMHNNVAIAGGSMAIDAHPPVMNASVNSSG